MTLFLFVKETNSPNPTVWSVREGFCSFGEEGIFLKGPSNLFHVFREGEGFRIKTKTSEFEVLSEESFTVDSYHITTLIVPEEKSDLYGEYRIGPVRHRFPMFTEISIGKSTNSDVIIPLSGVGSYRLKRGEMGIEVLAGEALNIDEWTVKILPSEIEIRFSG